MFLMNWILPNPTDSCTDMTSRAVLSRMSVELRASLREVVRRVSGGGPCISFFLHLPTVGLFV